MSYKQAAQILPPELLEQVQQYVDGEYLYIPRAADNKKDWGASTNTRQELRQRNERICQDYAQGVTVSQLAQRYFLSAKSIRRILSQAGKK